MSFPRRRNVNIETIQDEKNYNERYGNGSSSTTHIGSSIEVANLDLKVRDTAKIEGSSISAAENLKIEAARIDILAVNDTSYYEKKSSSKGFLSSQSSTEKRFTSTSKASNLSGGNIELKTTSNDLTITGSNVQAQNDLTLDSAQDINIKTGYDGSFKEKKTTSGGFFSGGKIFSETEDLSGKMTKTAVASNITAGNVTLKSNRDLLIEGSNLSGGTITGEARNITVKAAENEEKTWSKHTEKSVGVTDLQESLTRPDKTISTKDKKLTAKVADAQYEDSDKSVKKTTVTSSNLDGENITLTANSEEDYQGNILVEGSNLNATDTIALTASNDVTVKEAKETTETKTASTKGSAELTVGVKHQAVEVLKAAEALQLAIKAKDQAKDAYGDYKDQVKKVEQQYKEGLIEKEDLDDVRDDERFYVANIVLTEAAAVAATQNLTQQAIAATASSGTYGFNAEVQLDIDAVVEKAKDVSTRSVGSTLAANTIEINAGNRAVVKGSDLNANEQIAIDAREVEIAASRDTNESSSSTDHAHVTVNYSVYGGLSANASADSSESNNKGTTYNNSRLNSKNISITSKEDTYVTGAVVKAEENLEMDVGRDLKVASLQDRSRSKSNSIGVSASAGGGSSTGGFNASLSNGKKQWVTEQTSLTGGIVNIDVANHTELKGAIIAAVDENGLDNGNLNLSTQSFSYEDIKNRDQNSNLSASVSVTNSEVQNKETGKKEDVKSGTGSAGFGFSNSLMISKATLGKGNITIGDQSNPDLKDLNRDLDNATVDVYSTGVQLDIDESKLNVLLNPVDTAETLVEDTIHVGWLGVAIGDMTANAVNEKSTFLEGLDSIAHGFDIVNGVAVIGKDEESEQHQRLKATEEASAEEVEKLGNEIFVDNQVRIGIDAEDASTIMLTSKDGIKDETIREYAAATDEGNKQSYLNVQQTDITDGGDILGSLWAETTRQKYAREYAQKPEGSDRNDEFETGVEKVGIGLAKGTWNMLSGETKAKPVTTMVNGTTTTLSARDAWYENNKDSSNIAAGNEKLNAAKDTSKVKPREVRVSEAQKLDSLKEAVNAHTDYTKQEKNEAIYTINALACAKVKCAEGVPESDENYETLKNLQSQGEVFAKSIKLEEVMANNGLTLSDGDFDYNWKDTIQDLKTKHEELIQRGTGSVVMVTGALETASLASATVATSPLCGSLIGCAVPAATAVGTGLAAAQTYDGYKMIMGDYTSTEGQHVMDSFSTETRDFDDRNLVRDVAIDAVLFVGEELLAKKVEKFVEALPDKFEKKIRGEIKEVVEEAVDSVTGSKSTKNLITSQIGDEAGDAAKKAKNATDGFTSSTDSIDEVVTWYHASLDKSKVESEGFSTIDKYGKDRKDPYVCVSTDCKAAQNAIDPKARYDAQYADPAKTGVVKGEISKTEWDSLHNEGHLTTDKYEYGFGGEKLSSSETKARTKEGVDALNKSMKVDLISKKTDFIATSNGNIVEYSKWENNPGLQREMIVAEIVDGQVMKTVKKGNLKDFKMRTSNEAASVDVKARNGDLIEVGGPQKGLTDANKAQYGKQLKNLKEVAKANNVKAKAYLTEDTPEAAVNIAKRRLGAENVELFSE